MLAPRLGANIGSSFAGDWNQERRRKPSRYFIECFRVYLKTPNAPGQRTFSRCAAPFFLEIRQYSCEKMSCSAQKFLAAGHIGSFQIHPTHFSYNPVVFLETAGFFQIMTPRVLFFPSQQPPRKSPKLPARRADVTAAGRTRPRGFVLLRRLRLLPLLKFACSRSFSAFAVPAMLPHVGATSGLRASGGYALGLAAKAAQTADTGATGWD